MVKIIFSEFYNIQKELNEKIFRCRNISFEEIKQKAHLALLTELMELCNETRCFNYWSKKQRSSDDIILEEFADVICFALSEYIYYGLSKETIIEFNKPKVANNNDVVDQFLKLISLYNQINNLNSIHNFMKELFVLGYMLGYDFNQILDAYKKKCIKNHGVQDNW